MAQVSDGSKRQQTTFVEALQQTVERSSRENLERKNLQREVQDAISNAFGKDFGVGVSVQARSEDADAGTLRVIEPTPSIVRAEVDPALKAQSVEFYITRPRDDAVVETRLLGIAKYRDSDNRWSVRFTTERFGRKPQEIHIIHAEVLDADGRLLAANGAGDVC
jgi:uncharacterized protein (UPF0335 family)